jgi:hypothetical protein
MAPPCRFVGTLIFPITCNKAIGAVVVSGSTKCWKAVLRFKECIVF